MLPPDSQVIPAALRARQQWVNWRYEVSRPTSASSSAKPTKVPVIAGTSARASTTNPSTWRTFDRAWAAARRSSGGLGVGYVFAADDPYVGIDLDGCVSISGGMASDARGLVERLGSYAEVSPSGTGVKIILEGQKPPSIPCARSDAYGCARIEVYDRARFFTITGQRAAGVPEDVRESQAALNALCAALWPPVAPVHRACAGKVARPEMDADFALEERERRCMRYLERCPDAITGQGGHDATLRAACECWRFGLDEAAAWRVMRWFNQFKTGGELWTDAEMAHKLASAREKVQTGGEWGVRLLQSRAAIGSVSDGIAPLADTAKLCTDIGNAARFVLAHAQDFRYCAATATWMRWCGSHWIADRAGAVIQACKEVALSIQREARTAPDESREALMRWAKRSQQRERIAAMDALARSDLPLTIEECDSDPWALNCRNGTIDLRTGELRPHRPDDLITKLAPVDYLPGAACPRFDAFLRRVFDGDAGLIEYVRRWHGYCLTGDVREQYLPIYHGEGCNGKSVLLDTVAAIMGEYAAEAPPHLITRRQHDEHPTEIADLRGRRLVIASETERSDELRIQMIKRLTGNARLKARVMRGDYFEFVRSHKLILVTNNLPVVREDSQAVRRRLRVVPFRVVIPSHERNPRLLDELAEERAGILAWMVRGCLDWQREGLGEPAVVIDATDAWTRQTQDIDRFLDECCEVGVGLCVRSGDLEESYERWSAQHRCVPLRGRALATALRMRGCEPDKSRGVRVWRNVSIRGGSEVQAGTDGQDA